MIYGKTMICISVILPNILESTKGNIEDTKKDSGIFPLVI